MTISANPLFRTKCPIQCLSQSDAHVLDRVVCVHFKITFGGDLHVKHPVPGNLLEHMLEKRHANAQIG